VNAVVVGASSGIGLAIARRFHAGGATVHALARRKTASPDDSRFHVHVADATDTQAMQRALDRIAAAGPLDVLIYCAGHNVPKRRVAECTPEDWDAIVRVNLDGAFYTVHAALPALRESRGLVILIGSLSVAWTNLSGAAYQASKAGLLALARAAAYEEHQNGVRFSAILPGVVDTPHLDRRPNPPTPQGRAKMLAPDDVASACWFLATLPQRAYVSELHLLPTMLQAPGKSQETAPPS
jgi:NAD(P)-dependent dehydrogenase (short-subunit alcohol dehydrogenase family)